MKRFIISMSICFSGSVFGGVGGGHTFQVENQNDAVRAVAEAMIEDENFLVDGVEYRPLGIKKLALDGVIQLTVQGMDGEQKIYLIKEEPTSIDP